MLAISKNLTPRVLAYVKPVKISPLFKPVARYASGGEEHEVNPIWPRTKEERERAAKKYNLIPEDYEPFPEDEAFGDYPNLKSIGALNRDKYDDYDDPVDMRFYGEVYHIDTDLYYWERIDALENEKNFPPLWKQLAYFLGAAATFPLLKWFIDEYDINFNHQWKKKTYLPPDTKFYEYPDKRMDEQMINMHH